MLILFMGFQGIGRVSSELTAPLTFILIKFQPEKCHMGYVPTIYHDFHGTGIYPEPSETTIYRSDLSGNARKVPEPSSSTFIFRKLAFRIGKMTCFLKMVISRG